jgi:beta-glucosidase
MRWLVVACSLAVVAGCSDPPEVVEEQPETLTEVSFPEGFVWGAASAGFQIESGLGATDWGAWAAMPGKIADGDQPDDGPDALAHIDDDVAALEQAGLDGYRFSIEMARIFPTRAELDADTPAADGLAAYDELFAALAAAGVSPMVTLHHFVWPIYMSDPAAAAEPQGWERTDAVEVFAEWCARMGATYGDRVDTWVTINEPTVEATVGYLATVFPPGVSDMERVVAVLKAQVEAHARCYDALHEADTVDADGDGVAAMVSIAKHNRVYEPRDADDERDREAVAHAYRFWNQWFLDAIVLGDVDEDFDDVVDVSADPQLAGRADYIGLNYYGVSQVDADSLRQPYLGNVPAQFDLQSDRPKNDLGWDIYPAGFAKVIDDAAVYGLPIQITENGIADALDVNRSRFLAEHLFEIGAAIARGVEVNGYFHWSLTDNFEWAGGFCPRFGLFVVDYDSAERARTATAAVSLLAQITASGELTRATIDALPAYTSEPASCSSF